MKKIVLAVMAVAAISFASCGNKTQQANAEAVDSVAIIDSMATAAAQGDIDAISGLLNGGDATKLQEALAAVKGKIATLIKENPEVAKEYVAKVQNFLKENADKVKAIVGDNAAVQSAVSAITDAEPAAIVSGFLSSVGDAATAAKDSAVSAANEKIEEGKQAVEDKANEVKDAAKQKANEAIDNAAKDVKGKLGL
jgi:hypothetical protein